MPGPLPAVVCVPARDEAERLPRLLRSLALQDGFDAGAPLPVVVLANNCRDGTADAVRALALPALDIRLVEAEYGPSEAHVGTARRTALDAGAGLAEAFGGDGILLTTDADARVPPGWVAANRAALEHAEIVGGRLMIDPDAGRPAAQDRLDAAIERYWSCVRGLEELYDPQAHDPAPRHGSHTGASLSLRASTYRAVGGLPPLPGGEDNALVARVVEAGGRLRHCPAVQVLASDRALGRAEGGMAREMARRSAVVAGAETYALPEPAHWLALVRRRAGLRRLWREGGEGLTRGLAALGLGPEEIAALRLETCPNDIAFVERANRLVEARSAPPAFVPLEEALAGLDAMLAAPERAA